MRKQYFNSFVGEYQIDLKKTKLLDYSKDSLLYQKLTLKIKRDSTFTFNMKVPFIFDSCGTWSAGAGKVGSPLGVFDFVLYNERSYIRFRNCTYLTELCDYFDSAICIHSPPPQPGEGMINNWIFFKRILKYNK